MLAQTQAQLLALTLGADRAVLLFADGRRIVGRDRLPVSVVDTVGAGDCFLAGLITWLLSREGHPLRCLAKPSDAEGADALAHALASASLCVEQRGCTPSSWGAVCERMRLAALANPGS